MIKLNTFLGDLVRNTISVIGWGLLRELNDVQFTLQVNEERHAENHRVLQETI